MVSEYVYYVSAMYAVYQGELDSLSLSPRLAAHRNPCVTPSQISANRLVRDTCELLTGDLADALTNLH